ncbi:MAG: hypothetical protein J1E79_03860 [Rikenella sp.]|nr:hypothetical protein [Rikenella sp.]
MRREKFPRTDSERAMQAGNEATDSPKKRIFRFNPGIDRQLFPPKHPYYKLSQESKEQVRKVVIELQSIPDIDLSKLIPERVAMNKHIAKVMIEHARQFPEDYNGGLLRVDIAKSKSAFMSNGRYLHRPGNILTVHGATFTFGTRRGIVHFNPAKEVREAFTAIRDGKTLTFNQEYALESLWHETLHAKAKGVVNKSLWNKMTSMQMETINQFVARHTYPDFVARFGGTAARQAEVLEHGYGYGSWVQNFRKMLEHYGIDEKEAVDALREKLLNEPYEQVGGCAVEYLKGKGVKNAEELMRNLSDSQKMFETRL